MANATISDNAVFVPATTLDTTATGFTGMAAYLDDGGALSNVAVSPTLFTLDNITALGDYSTRPIEVRNPASPTDKITYGHDNIANNSGNFEIDSAGILKLNAPVSSDSDMIQLNVGTTSPFSNNGRIKLNSYGLGVNAKIHLETATNIRITLPTPPTVGQVLSAKNSNGDVEWMNPTFREVSPEIDTNGLIGYYDAGNYNMSTETLTNTASPLADAKLQIPLNDPTKADSSSYPRLYQTPSGGILYCKDTHLRVTDVWSQTNYTQEAWINFTDKPSSYNGIIDFSPSEEYAMYYDFSGNDDISMSENGLNEFPIPGGVIGDTPTGWKHCVITFESDGVDEANSTVKVYINGVEEASATGTAGIGIGPGANTYLDLCCSSDGAGGIYGFEGFMGYIALYDVTLSGPTVLSNFDATKERFGVI
jgi:hypothetical protein